MSVICDKDADPLPEFTTECCVQRNFIAEGKIPQGEEKANTILPVVPGQFPIMQLNWALVRYRTLGRVWNGYVCLLSCSYTMPLISKKTYSGNSLGFWSKLCLISAIGTAMLGPASPSSARKMRPF
jgi:hypothetical protein